jgi:cytoskeleton protein RodZ
MEPGMNQGAGVAASGVALKQAREARGISLNEAARMLKLAPRQIEAIEAEEFDKLPGLAWVRGFVRNYARFLELDPAPFLERIETPIKVADMRLAPESNAQGTVPSSPDGYRSHSPMPAILLVVVVVVVGLLAWHFDIASLLARKVAEPQHAAPTATASEPAFPPHTDETAVVTAQVEEPGAEASAPVAAPAVQASAPAVQASAPRAAASQPAAAALKPAAIGSGDGTLVFDFAQDAWVEVRDASNKIIYSRLNKAGEKQEVRGTPPFALVVGNSPNVRLSFNGQSVDLAAHTKVSVARLSLK